MKIITEDDPDKLDSCFDCMKTSCEGCFKLEGKNEKNK